MLRLLSIYQVHVSLKVWVIVHCGRWSNGRDNSW